MNSFVFLTDDNDNECVVNPAHIASLTKGAPITGAGAHPISPEHPGRPTTIISFVGGEFVHVIGTVQETVIRIQYGKGLFNE